MVDRAYSVKDLARLCDVSEMTVRKWMKGALPQNRDMYICIGFAAGYGLDEMNEFLRKYGRCPQLYVKSLEDSVCMFVLQSASIEHTYNAYKKTLEKVQNEVEGIQNDHDQQVYGTMDLSNFFARVRSEAEMIAFAQEHVPSYKEKYNRLYDYIMEYVRKNCKGALDESNDKTSFGEMARGARWPKPLIRCISDIGKKRWFPQRQKIIALGLRLNMDVEAINKMLEYAQMAPLYARSPFEAAIMWAIQEAKLSTVVDEIVTDGSSYLCNDVKKTLTKLGIEEEGIYSIDDFYVKKEKEKQCQSVPEKTNTKKS